MKEKPIIFNGEMVRAILAGRKTQTRRIVDRDISNCFDLERDGSLEIMEIENAYGDFDNIVDYAPYQVGDHLWVRETFIPITLGPLATDPAALYKCDNDYKHVDGSKIPNGTIVYKSTIPNELIKWTPSIHMPRWASRITLEITGVRLERLQEITFEDVEKEGLNVARNLPAFPVYKEEANNIAGCVSKSMFKELWQSIYADKPGKTWQDNPWVWVYEFRRV